MRAFKIKENILFNGECIEVMTSLINKGIKIDAIITDLPYKVTTCSWDALIPFNPMWKCINSLIKDYGAICLFGCEPFSSALRLSNLEMFKYDWIWHKSSCSNFIAANYQPRRTHELISVFSKGAASYTKKGNKMTYFPQMGEKTKDVKRVYEDRECRKAFSKKSKEGYKLIHNNTGRKFPESIIYFPSDTKKIHPTQKPVALMEYLIRTYSKEGDIILDFTAGSFTTAIACINVGDRKFIGIEKDLEIFNKGLERVKDRCSKT